jgi:hypothetical protein
MSFLLFFLYSVSLLFFGVYSERERCTAILSGIFKKIEQDYEYAVRRLQELKQEIKEEDDEDMLELLKLEAENIAEAILLYKASKRIKEELNINYNFKIE